MSDKKTEKINRLQILNVLRRNSGLTLTEVTRGVDLTSVTVRKHLTILENEGHVSRESGKYFLTKKGEEEARFLETTIRTHQNERGLVWGRKISLPQITVMATAGLPTVTFIGYDGNSISNIYERFKSFVESAKNEGFVFFGTLKVSCHWKDG